MARRALPLLVALVALLPSFAYGDPSNGTTEPLVPDCTAKPPGFADPPAATPLTPVDDAVSAGTPFVGTLPGAGGVTPAGEYTYRIPIEVPAGRAGMQPSLALVYGSRGSNGLLGVGWHIEGLSEINRCPKTMATEGVSDGIHFDSRDALCLDGHKLISINPFVSRDDGCTGTEYRTEDDIFARIASCKADGENGQIEKFVVWLKNGRIRTYLPNDVKSVADRDVRFNWLLDEERDRAGNSVHYSYEKTPDSDGNEYHPYRIDYTYLAGAAAPTVGRRTVAFEYNDKNSAPRADTEVSETLDESSTTQDRVKLLTSRLLRGIHLSAPSATDPTAVEEVWHYALDYVTADSPMSGRHLLTKVARCGRDDTCSLAKVFKWERGGTPTYDVTTFQGPQPLHAPYVADLNGDGRDEVVFDPYDGSSWLVALTTQDPAAPLTMTRVIQGPSSVTPNFANARISDVDGDGRDEMVVPDQSIFGYQILSLSHVFDSDPVNTYRSVPGESYDPGNNEPLFLADLDGDGLPDLVKGEPNGSTYGDWSSSAWAYRLNQGNWTFNPAVAAGVAGPPLQMQDDLGWHNLALGQDQGYHRATIFPASPANSSDPTASDAPWGFRLDNIGAVAAQAKWSGPDGSFVRATADLNGDGIREPVWLGMDPIVPGYGPTYKAILCTEQHGCSKIEWMLPDEYGDTVDGHPYDHSGDTWKLQIADVDADGRDDIVVSYLPYQWAESGFDPVDPYAWPLIRVFRLGAQGIEVSHDLPHRPDAIGDFDGDGLLDLATYDLVQHQWYVYRQTGIGRIDRLVEVADEKNVDHAREKVTYSTAWSPSPDPSTCSHPQRCMRHGFAVVREHDVYQGEDTHPAPGGTQYQRHLYNYEDPRTDVRGRGFLGFGTVRHWEPNRFAETITTYDNETADNGIYPYAQLPKRVRAATVLPDGSARVAQTDFSYTLRYLNQGKTYAVFPSGWTSREWEVPVTLDSSDAAKIHLGDLDGVSDRAALRTRYGAALYDDYGNEIDSTTSTTGGVVTHATSSYEIRTADWLVSLLKTQDATSIDASSSAFAVPRHVEYDYESRGLLCHTYIEKGNPDPDLPEVLTYFHDEEGLVRAVTASAAGDPTLRTTHVAYEPNERVHAAEVWNDLGHAQAFLRHPGLGVLLAYADENGVQTHWKYDDLGRTVAVMHDGQAKVSVQYSQRKDATDINVVIGMYVDVTDEAGSSSRTTYDELGRVIGRQHAGFDGSPVVQATQYDTLGRVVLVSRPGAGAPYGAGVLNPYGLGTTYEYDNLDRLVQESRLGSETTHYEHAFFQTAAIDPMGHERDVIRDMDGRVAASTEVTPQATLKTYFQYGDFGQLVRTTDPRGNDITAMYDARGRRIFVEDPDAGFTEFRYNGFGDLKAAISNGIHTRSYQQDILGRTYEIDYDDNTAAKFRWDLGPNANGRVVHTESPDGVLQDFEYDTFGRSQADTWTVDGHAYRFDYEYDSFGHLGRIQYPTVPGRPRMDVRQFYNGHGYMSQISQAVYPPGGGPSYFANLWAVDTRNVDDRLTHATLVDGEVLSRTYDPGTGRLTALDDGPAFSLEYQYDFEGKVVRRDDNVLKRHEVFSHDELHRLTGWTLSATATPKDVAYGYDDLGNLTSLNVNGVVKDVNVYGTNQLPHALTSNYEGHYEYDDRGRQYRAPGRVVTYTEFDLPSSITTSGGTTSFAYDAAQGRVKKDGPSGSVITLGGLYERRESGTSVQHVFYVQGPDGPVAQTVYDEGTGDTAIELLHVDPLGSVGAVTDDNGTVLDRLYYEPFGGRVDASGQPTAGPAKDVLLGFTGDRHDDELGLIDMHGRMYDPGTRRFLTPDPLVADPLSTQSYNRYSYVLNNPLNLVDPTGFAPDCADWWNCPLGGGIFGFNFSFDGSRGTNGVSNPTFGAWGAGTSTPKYRSGAPIQVSGDFSRTSWPTGPSAPATSVMGPPPSPLGEIAKRAALDGLWKGVNQLTYNIPGIVWEASRPTNSVPVVLAQSLKLMPVLGNAISVGEDLRKFYDRGSRMSTGEMVTTGLDAALNAVGLGFAARGAMGGSVAEGVAAEGGATRGVALPDSALVCRGGTCTADRFATGSGVTLDSAGRLQGVSVQSGAGLSLEQLTATIPNRQVGVTTVGEVRALGGDVIPSPRVNNPYHCTLCSITPQQAESLFTPTVRNPSVR